MKRTVIFSAIFSYFIINFSIGFAQQDTIFSMSLEQLMQLKVKSVSKREENVLKAPQTLIVITEQQLKRCGYTDLEQIFHDLPGFDISRGNGTAYSQVYQRGYRSNSTERTLLLIDGVEENDLWSNGVLLSRQYPLSHIKRVEIIYGPASTIYGANAFLGVINIVTKNAGDIIRNNKNAGVYLSAGYGSWNTKYADISVSARYKQAELTATGRIYQSDEMDLSGYDNYDYDLAQYDLNYYKNILQTENDAIAQAAMDLDSEGYHGAPVIDGNKLGFHNITNDWSINTKLKIDNFISGFQVFRREEGYGAWYRDDFDSGNGKWIPYNSFYYTKYNKKFTDNFAFEVSARFKIHQTDGASVGTYYHGYMNGYYDLSHLTDDNGNLLPEADRTATDWWIGYFHTYSQQLRNEYKFIYSPFKKLNMISGFEYRRSHIQGSYIVGDEKNPEENATVVNVPGGNHFYCFEMGFYTQADYSPLDNLTLIAGGRYDYNKIRVNGGYGGVFNPKLAVVYLPGRFIVKGMYSEAFQDASFWTKYGTTQGRLLNNPNLEPEKVKNLECNITWKIRSDALFNIAAYHATYHGAVGTVNVTYTDENGNQINTTQHQAVGDYSIQGLQSRFTIKKGNTTAYANYSFTNPHKISDDDEKIRVGDIASHRVNAGVNHIFLQKLNVNLRINWVGKRVTGENTTVESNPLKQIEPYFVLHGAVTYNITQFLTIQFTARNILNREYFHPGVRAANGKNYAAKLPQNRFNFMGKIMVNL